MQENVKLVTVKKTVRQAYRTEPIWQYDVGHVLNLEGFDNLPETFQMHYSHSAMGDAITQIGSNGQVSLPDEFAQTSAPIFAWVYVAEDDTGLTKYTIEIPVMRRAKITNQEPTPVEQSAIDQAISALNAGVSSAETAAANAESSEDAASASAESAYRSSEAAAGAAESAQGDATAAGRSATAAAESASAAAASAVSAGGSATTAGNAATSAQAAANTATQKSGEAVSSANSAAASALSAGNAAQTATQKANDATSAATSAQGSASAASGSATAAGQSATAAAGSAAAAAQTKTEIDDEVDGFQAQLTNLSSALNQIDEKVDGIHEVPPGGASGQILTKKSGTDYDVEWNPVGMPSDEQVGEAVSGWLDDHPEATTTVEDGAITIPKFSQDTRDTVVVQAETEKAGFHNITPTEVSFYPDVRLTGVTAKYTNQKNLVDDIYYRNGNVTQNGITSKRTGILVDLTGTGTGQYIFINTLDSEVLARFAGKTVNLYVFIKKANPWGNSSYYALYVNASRKVRVNFTSGGTEGIGWNEYKNINIPDDVNQIIFKFDSLNGTTFTDGDCIWVGIYESELVDTLESVTGDIPFTTSVTGINCIDTATHESIAKYIMPTKEYVDNHIPDIKSYWTEEIYALPEKFGAVGDGITDDSTAIGNCIEYAKTTGKAVRGFGTYKTTQPVVIGGRDMDVFFRKIVYTGNGNAIELSAIGIVFGFHTIQSSNVGLAFVRTSSTSPFRCQVTGNEINSASHCIYIDNSTYYNTCDIRYLSSTNGDCIHRDHVEGSSGAGEYVFNSSSCRCPNGWVSYEITVSKFYNFTIEGDCKYGFLNPFANECYGCRHIEQTDGMKIRVFDESSEYNNGPLIKFSRKNGYQWGFTYDSQASLCWFNIDVSDISGYDPVPNNVSLDEWQALLYCGEGTKLTLRGANSQSRKIIGGNAYIIGGNLVVEPNGRINSIVDISTVDFRLFDSAVDADIIAANDLCKYLGTDYVIDVSHASIYFNAYFGAIGYNDLTITQSNGNTVTIYDKLGNIIFDGTNLGNGKWQLKCIMDRSSFGRYQGTTNWWGYDGTNEKWEITKLE